MGKCVWGLGERFGWLGGLVGAGCWGGGPQTSNLRPHSGDFHHIPEKSFFYLQRTVIVEKKVLNRVLKMPKRQLVECGFKIPYFGNDF